MEKKSHEYFMKRAIELSEKAAFIEKTGGAFGCVIVKDGEIISEGYNQVIKTNDPTWHAEMHAIREAAKKLKTFDLSGCVMYTSAECCPMCLGAAYWAYIKEIYYSAKAEDVLKYGDFQDFDMYEDFKKQEGERKIPCKNICREESIAVWKKFSISPDRVHY